MKRVFALIIAFSLFFTSCSSSDSSSSEPESSQPSSSENMSEYEVRGSGYGGEMVLKVSMEEESISDIEIVSHKETDVVFDRAFPIIKERIIEAQSPIVDNVSGATISSYAVKTAVNSAFNEIGKDFGDITISTEPERSAGATIENASTSLLIVGGGPAGLSAAIAAKQNGVEDVMLIEKLDILSGNGKFDLEFYDHYNSEAQKNAGVEITKEEFIESKAGTIDSRERVNVWAEVGYTLDSWFRDMGINLNHIYGTTSHMAETDMYAGEHIQEQMEKTARDLGVEIRTGTAGTDLIMENGTAVGVVAQTRDGIYNITADAIIIATGGFSYNNDLIAQYAPGYEVFTTSNQMGATGDFIPEFIENGIQLANMDFIRIFKVILTQNKHLTGGGDGFILVNNEGNRFVDETKEEMEIANEMISQPEGDVYYVYDQRLYDSAYRLQKHNDLGYHIKANSIEELATELEIDAQNLQASIDAYNMGVRGESADPFREHSFTEEFSSEGPFYAAKVQPAVHMTKGGVVANEKAQVLYENGNIVPNLYAAGEVTSVSGGYQVSVVFGKVAGEEAAKMLNEVA